MEQTTHSAAHAPEGPPHVDPPMSSPAPVLAVVAAIAILVLGGLMATDFIWSASHPVTVAHTPASTTAPTTTTPAAPHG